MVAPSEEGYIIEFTTIGKTVKVTAFDPHSLREACIIGAAGLSQTQLAGLAVRKLRYVLAKTKAMNS